MDITYRQANASEAEEICKLNDDLILRYEDFSSVNKEKAIGWTHLTILDNIERYSVILCDGHKAGYFFVTYQDNIYELRHLFILPKYQNRGIGTQVIKQCIEDTQGNLQVFVFTGDLSTYFLFENLGFETVEVFHRTRYKMLYAGK